MEIEHFQLPVWIIAAHDGRSFSAERDGKQFVPICDNENAASTFMLKNKLPLAKLTAKPVSSIPNLLRVLTDSRDNGCKYLGRVSGSGSLLLVLIDLAINTLQEKHKQN